MFKLAGLGFIRTKVPFSLVATAEMRKVSPPAGSVPDTKILMVAMLLGAVIVNPWLANKSTPPAGVALSRPNFTSEKKRPSAFAGVAENNPPATKNNAMMSVRKDMIPGLLDTARCYLRLIVGPEWEHVLLRESGQRLQSKFRGSGMAEILNQLPNFCIDSFCYAVSEEGYKVRI